MRALGVAVFGLIQSLMPCRADVGAQLIALNCMSCHREDAHSSKTDIPALDGLSEQQISQALLDFKYDRTGATLMPRIAKGYSDEELRSVAASIANLVSRP